MRLATGHLATLWPCPSRSGSGGGSCLSRHSAQGLHHERAHAGRDFIREVTMVTVETMPRHPAKYTDVLLPVFARILREYGAQSVLDPMAGVGKIGLLRDYGFSGRIVANEIEPEWAAQAPAHVEMHIGDAAAMTWARDGEFDAIVTSPTYGNR